MTRTTENRVFRWVARWFMRFEAAGNILRILLFGGTFLSTGLSALYQYGYPEYAGAFILAVSGGTVVFAYVYAEYGVYNQKNRDTADVGDNYSGPTMLMDARIEARQLARLAHVLQNGSDVALDELEREMENATVDEWAKLRDGIDVDQLENEYNR